MIRILNICSRLKTIKLTLLLCVCCYTGYSQIALSADGPGETYELINSKFAPGYEAIEVPDCNHENFGRHITEIWDDELNKFVFNFHLHVYPDNDRCQIFDRQRNEIKTYANSPDSLLAVEGETVIYKWKFKLDQYFQPTESFTHIHQMKSRGGDTDEEKKPLITLTVREEFPAVLQLRYSETTSIITLDEKDLSLFKGEWIEATEQITFGENGKYELSLVRWQDDETLFYYNNDNIRMWKTDADFIRPKWGIYRNLVQFDLLRDEEVLFADFSIEEVDQCSETNEEEEYDDCVEIDFEQFEYSFGLWNDSGSDCNRGSYGVSESSLHTVRLRDNTSNASATYTELIDFGDFESIEIDFSFYAVHFADGEDFFFEFSDDGGDTYEIIKSWVAGSDFENENWYQEHLIIDDNLKDDCRLRIRCDASRNSDKIYFDDILIKGCFDLDPIPELEEKITKLESKLLQESNSSENNIIVLPNPSTDFLNIKLNNYHETEGRLLLYNVDGVLVYEEIINNQLEYNIKVSHFDTGIYFLVIKIQDQPTTVKKISLLSQK